MSQSAQPESVDPLRSFIAGVIGDANRQLPLAATTFDVQIFGGLAIVLTTRVFRNEETESVEAVLTFPVPVHAVLFSLDARVAGRLFKARVQARTGARATYEDAVERGKTTVLHEEVLRGVHMLSIGHVPPNAEVEVTTIWAITLSNLDGVGHLRIPLTVGDVYGRSGLVDSDELIHGGIANNGTLKVQCPDGTVRLVGGTLDRGCSEIPLDAPIDLQVTEWAPKALYGRAADGREVSLRIEPLDVSDIPLNVAVLIDCSGSMADAISASGPAPTKHRAVLSGLVSAAGTLRGSDILDVWEFGDVLRHVGSTEEHTNK